MSPKWKELPSDEWEALKRFASGNAQLIDGRITDQLKSRGLVEQKLGGPGISAAGKRVHDEWAITVIAARRARERETAKK